jgi:hypothetical protein
MSFPFVLETGERVNARKPHDRVNVVGHDDEADTPGRRTLDLLIEHSQDNPLRLIEIEQASPPIAAESHEVCVQLVIYDLAAIHTPYRAKRIAE